MPPVFAHGRLRLYLLKLLDEAPRHGYEVIRLLEERFQGLYAPSAGTVYPRLAKLEAEGLVTHATEGGRKVYSITDAGRAELAGRTGELADLELEIRESVSELAAEMRDDVRGAAGKLRSEMRAAADESRHTGSARPGGGRAGTGKEPPFRGFGDFGDLGDNEAWRTAKEELRKAKQEWKEQARRAKDESRRAREEAQQARRQAKEAQDRAREQMQNAARQVQEHFARGDWPAGVREGLAELTGTLGGFARTGTWPPYVKPEPADADPDWGKDAGGTGDPARDLDRLLDRFRDDIRDAARDRGVTEDQLTEARRLQLALRLSCSSPPSPYSARLTVPYVAPWSASTSATTPGDAVRASSRCSSPMKRSPRPSAIRSDFSRIFLPSWANGRRPVRRRRVLPPPARTPSPCASSMRETIAVRSMPMPARASASAFVIPPRLRASASAASTNALRSVRPSAATANEARPPSWSSRASSRCSPVIEPASARSA